MIPMRRLFIGVMSGTSLDGADAVLAEFPSAPETSPSALRADDAVQKHAVLAHCHKPFPADLRAALLGLQQSASDELHRSALAANALADHYAALIRQVLALAGLQAADVIAAGVHGQTVRHRPELGYTLQLNSPARLAEACAIDVISDFRSRDVAAGGQGAPLVPAFHAHLFGNPDMPRVVVNIGGISNVTDLTSGHVSGDGRADSTVRGWDTGPGNILLDTWIGRRRGQAYDALGEWAASGSIIVPLLERMLAEPWFERPPPKSTGRDLFNGDWLNQLLSGFENAQPQDIQATLAECSAASIATELARHCPKVKELIVCGGGAFNADLLARLARHVGPGVAVVTSATRGVPPDQVEALAFAWLAHRFDAGLPGNLPAVTGASAARILGSRTPR